jgi:dCMP deaminase
MTPCSTCAKIIINTDIKKIVCEKKYHAGEESEELFRQAGVELEHFENSVEGYDNQ